MKAITTIFVMLLAGVASAQDAPDAAAPDYSRDALEQIFEVHTPPAEEEPPVRFGVGVVEFRALNTRWQFAYLPMLAPLPGSVLRTTSEWPDAFALTGTAMATSSRPWRKQRSVARDLRSIKRRARLVAD